MYYLCEITAVHFALCGNYSFLDNSNLLYTLDTEKTIRMDIFSPGTIKTYNDTFWSRTSSVTLLIYFFLLIYSTVVSYSYVLNTCERNQTAHLNGSSFSI